MLNCCVRDWGLAWFLKLTSSNGYGLGKLDTLWEMDLKKKNITRLIYGLLNFYVAYVKSF